MLRSIRTALFATCLALMVLARLAAAQINAGTDSGVGLTLPAPRQSFTVGILADRTTGYDSGLAVLERAVEELNLLRPDLVLHIGDLVPGYMRDMERWERDIIRFREIIDQLEAPFFPVAGNHDVITGTGDNQDRRGEELHKRHFGPLYYSFDYESTHFVMLYTEESLESRPRFSHQQIEWLRADLAATEAQHVFVLMHKPVWEYPGNEWEPIHAILKPHPVRAVIAGHFHHYYKSQLRDGIQYYVVGVTGGRLFSPEAAGGLEHYCLLHIDDQDWRLALVRPGCVLPDDHIVAEDFKPMERLRFLSHREVGVEGGVRSPELGPVDGRVAVRVTNPLGVPLPVTVRGVARGGGWIFDPPARTVPAPGGQMVHVELGIRSEVVSAFDMIVPEVEVIFTYTDSKDRQVALPLRRRIPLVRNVSLPFGPESVSLDGRAAEPAWETAAVLTTARWRASPYESEEEGPEFRLLASLDGLYLHASSPDAAVSSFRGRRMLSDALFVGLAPPSDPGPQEVIILYPFAPADETRATRGKWDERTPSGAPVEGVRMVALVREGWQCEAFVPWDILLTEPPIAPCSLRLNIGAWDNDGELFTELHTWTPTDRPHWGILRLLPD